MNAKKAYIWLDMIRGVASLMVVAGHIRALTLSDYDSNKDIGAFGKLFYFLTGMGHQAVIIFFVLSGFLITKSIYSSVSDNRWSPIFYSIDRLSRLWTVLIPVLFLTLFFDKLGTYFFPDSLSYSGQIRTLPGINPADKSDIITFTGNIFFLQGICVKVFGSNTPLWSLSYEFWYYCIFPLIFFSFYKNTKVLLRIIFLILAFILIWFIGLEAVSYFLIWLMGAVSFFYYQKWKEINKKSLFATMLFLIFVVVLSCTRLGLFPKYFNDFSLGFISAILISFLSAKTISATIWEKTATFSSKISYTTYLLHMPLGIFFSSWISKERSNWGIHGIGIYTLTFLLVLFSCYIAWFFFERNTFKIKQIMKSRIKVFHRIF